MENEQAFGADAVIDKQVRARSARTNGGGDLGATSGVAANGGYDKHVASAHSEEAPLLGEGSGPNGRRESTWAGELDFEGQPWWNRPSVCRALGEMGYNLINLLRCTGYSRPSSSTPWRSEAS